MPSKYTDYTDWLLLSACKDDAKMVSKQIMNYCVLQASSVFRAPTRHFMGSATFSKAGGLWDLSQTLSP